MTTAKITRCNHYFHGVCLRKWLYVQDRCPLCHEIIMNPDDGPATDGGAPVQGAGATPAAVLAGREDSSSPAASAESNSNSSSSNSSNSSSNNHNSTAAGGLATAAATAASSPAPVVEQSEQHGWEADAATVGFRRREVR